MAKSKRKPLSLKRPKRMLPKNREGGVNPLLVAGGAAAGYKAGGAISERKRQASATRKVSKDYTANMNSTRFNDSPNARMAAATKTFDDIKYYGLPSVGGNKLSVRKEIADAMYEKSIKGGKAPLGRDYEKIGKRASKAAGLTRREQKVYETRKSIRRSASSARNAEDMLSAATRRQRFATGTSGSSRRSRIAGGLSGAAISAIAQLVAAELRKKR